MINAAVIAVVALLALALVGAIRELLTVLEVIGK